MLEAVRVSRYVVPPYETNVMSQKVTVYTLPSERQISYTCVLYMKDTESLLLFPGVW
jgi:hypothetical protein